MSQRSAGEPLRVLVADGDTDMRFYLRSCLRRLPVHPVRLEEAANDVTGVRGMNAAPPVDVLICAAEGRGDDGNSFELTLDAAHRGRAAVILLSDAGTAGKWTIDGGEAPVPGAVLLGKPFNATQLVDAVSAALGALQRTGNILI